MFVQDFLYLDSPPDQVQAATSRALSADADRAVEVSAGEALERGGALVVPLSWTATSEIGPPLRVDADLEIAPMGARRTRVALTGHYDLPEGVGLTSTSGRAFRELAERTTRSILLDVVAQPTTAVAANDSTDRRQE
jgi:hypothetical protein